MKKFLFAIAAIAVMVCTAVSLTSCGDDEVTNNMLCSGYWTVAYESGKTETTESTNLLNQLNSRATAIMGTSYYSEYDTSTTKLNESQIAKIASKMESDSQCKSLIEQLLALDNISEVRYYIMCSSTPVGVYYRTK